MRPAQAAANVGILLAKEGKIIEARQVLNKALALEPDLQAARLVLTKLEATSRPDKAAEWKQKLVEFAQPASETKSSVETKKR